jgi:hypothetical protein
MSSYEHILVEREDGVGIVTLNRPEVYERGTRPHGRRAQHRQL